MTPAQRRPLLEMLAMTALLGSFIWIWRWAFPGAFVVCVALYIWLGVTSHRRRGESARDIGFRTDNLARSAREVALFIVPLVLLLVTTGALLGTLNLPDLQRWPTRLPKYLLSGTAQQYGLLAFYYRGTSEIVSGRWASIWAASGCFALFHLPNPFLTMVTLLAGVAACWLYRRTPNLWVLGAAHAVLSFSISRSLPPEVTYGMRVGPGFFRMWERIHEAAPPF